MTESKHIQTNSLTLGEAYKALVKLGLPVLVTQLGAILVGFADTMMIGAYGTNELASAAFVNNFYMVPMMMLMGFSGGLTPLIGALFGKCAHRDIGSMLRVGVRLNLLVSLAFVLIMGVLYFFLPCFGQDPVLLPFIRPYYLLVLFSMPFSALFFACLQMSNGVNDTATPMWTIIGGNILNVFGNYVLIFGHFGMPELGLTGAGVSTLLARVASALVMWLVVTRSGKFHAYREGYRALEAAQASEMRRQIFRTSWPVMLQTGIECFLWALGAVVCGWYGKQQLAAYQVVLTISQLGFMTYMSVTTAVSIKVANYAGTHNVHSMRVTTRAGLHITLALATLASLLFILLGSWMVGGFTADAQVRSLARLLILPLVVYQYGDAIQMTFANALRGTGNVAPMLWISAVCYLIVGVPALMLLADILDLESVGVYYSFSVALFLAAYLYLRSFRLTLAGIAAHLQA